MSRHTKAKRKREQQMHVVIWVLLLSRARFLLLTVSGKTGLLGERAGETAVLGPPNTGGSNLPTTHIQCTHCDAWMSSKFSAVATLQAFSSGSRSGGLSSVP